MSAGTYPIHPYAEIFPLREGPRLIELSDDISVNGLHVTIVLAPDEADGGKLKVLDGRRRQFACIRARVKPRYRIYGDDDGDGPNPLEWAYGINKHTRNDLSKAEMEEAAIRFADMKRGYNEAKTPNGAAAPLGKKPMSLKAAAKKTGASPAAVKRRKAVLKHGTPELIEAMRAEKVTVTDAELICKEAPEVQKAAVEAVVAGSAPTLKAAVEATKPPDGPDKDDVAAEIEAAADRLVLVQTANLVLRDQMVANLKKIGAAVRKLPTLAGS
jgi:ParB-like chromosome segregation protein Spo0J